MYITFDLHVCRLVYYIQINEIQKNITKMQISKKLYFPKGNINIFIFHCQVFIFHCHGTELRVKHYATKCKICFSSSINFVYNKEKIQIFGANMTIISLNKAKKCIFHLWLWPMKYTFFHLLGWIKVIFIPKVWITSIHQSYFWCRIVTGKFMEETGYTFKKKMLSWKKIRQISWRATFEGKHFLPFLNCCFYLKGIYWLGKPPPHSESKLLCWKTAAKTCRSPVTSAMQQIIVTSEQQNSTLTLVLLNQDRHCLRKQCRSRSDGFWRSHLIRIYTVFHSVCEFIWTNNIELSDWLTVRNGCGRLNLFSRTRVKCWVNDLWW